MIPKDAPVHGGEKLETKCVNSNSVPVTKLKQNVALSNKGQGGENVSARYMCTGRPREKPETCHSTLWVPLSSICSVTRLSCCSFMFLCKSCKMMHVKRCENEVLC